MYGGTYTEQMQKNDAAAKAAQARALDRQSRLDAIVAEIESRTGKDFVQCNCDLDNWQPERSTGHSWVCRIHKMAMSQV